MNSFFGSCMLQSCVALPEAWASHIQKGCRSLDGTTGSGNRMKVASDTSRGVTMTQTSTTIIIQPCAKLCPLYGLQGCDMMMSGELQTEMSDILHKWTEYHMCNFSSWQEKQLPLIPEKEQQFDSLLFFLCQKVWLSCAKKGNVRSSEAQLPPGEECIPEVLVDPCMDYSIALQLTCPANNVDLPLNYGKPQHGKW